MPKAFVRVEVNYEEVRVPGDKPGETKTEARFLNLKIGKGQPIPLPTDALVPRRLVRELTAAVVDPALQETAAEEQARLEEANKNRPNDEDRTNPQS